MIKLLLTIFFLAFVIQVHAQSRLITGKVISSENKNPLPGVNVRIEGTTLGTVTDREGDFSIEIEETGIILVFSYIGRETKKIQTGNNPVINVELAPEIRQLSDVVVTGTGTAINKKLIGISVETIASDRLTVSPTSGVDLALIGKIPGVNIQLGNGTPGAKANIIIRGINSINRGTAPMILLDGIQLDQIDISSIDLSTIDHVEVVEGAAAGTIYGAQGANGVIQLFTKKGKNGHISINFSSGIACNQYLNTGHLHKAEIHGFETDNNNNVIGSNGKPLTQDPVTLIYDQNVIWNSTDPAVIINKPYNRNLKYHDHLKEFFGNAYVASQNISISGGNNNVTFYFAGSHLRQQSNLKGDGFNERTNFTSNIQAALFKNFQFGSNTQLIYTRNTIDIFNKPEYGLNAMLAGLFNARPFADFGLKDTQGDYGINYGGAAGANHWNPNYYLQYDDTRDNKFEILQNFGIDYSLPKFADFNLKYGFCLQDQIVEYLAANQSRNANIFQRGWWAAVNNLNDNHGEVSDFMNKSFFQHFQGTMNFSIDFIRDLKLGIPLISTTLVSYDYRNKNQRNFSVFGLGIPEYPPITADQASEGFKISKDYTEKFVTYGTLINQRILYGEMAGFSIGLRSDYSSAFGRGSKSFNFPRSDLFVRISSFPFWDKTGLAHILPEWKIRAAWGKAGIQPRPYDRYPTLTPYIIGNTESFYLKPAYPNPNLNVEVSTETEIGTDILLNSCKGEWINKLWLSATYWDRKTHNGIIDVDEAPSTGIGTTRDNTVTMSSKGWQAAVNLTLLKNRNLSWDLTANFGKQTSVIDKIKGNLPILITSHAGSTNYLLKAGEEIGQLYGYKMLHGVADINPQSHLPYIPPGEQANYAVASNGYVVNIKTKSPFVTPDQYPLGDPFPKLNMSLIQDLTYKEFLIFGMQFDFSIGNHLYNQTKEWMYRDGVHSDYTIPISIQGEKPQAYAAFYKGAYAGAINNGTKNYFYEDASFVRLRNIYLGIDFAKFYKMHFISSLRLLLSGRNLITWTRYTGMDPEISSGEVNSSWDRGTDHYTLPNYKTYQATLMLGF